MGPPSTQHRAGISLHNPLRAVERLIDRLDRNTPVMDDGAFVDDLFGAPTLIEIALYESTKLAVAVEQSSLRTRSSRLHHRLRRVRLIVAVNGSNPLQFAAHRRHGAAQLGGDHARRLPRARTVGDPHSLALVEVSARLVPSCCRSTIGSITRIAPLRVNDPPFFHQ